ncbi:MAG: ribosome biogenesis GTPase Der [Verrucomicrobiae bacterium]|nr:ribosome biogenesis GTPase Der [Verrucomicrobiae bacterium]
MPLRVAIVGRPNVGKSALFNRLVRRHLAIVHDQPGVTRDRVAETVWREGLAFEFVDTGGFGLREAPETSREIAEAVRRQAEAAIASSDVLLFVVDGQTGLEPLDQEVAARLRKSGKRVWLGVNKLDQTKHDARATEFHELGFETMFLLSATHGRGVSSLWNALAEAAAGNGPETAAASVEERPPRVAVVGRPNVGKSSLVNRLLGEERVIVSETPGTTRDAVDLEVAVGERRYVLVDTAGVRHKRRIHTHVEMWSRHRAEKSVARAQVALLLISAPDGPTRQDCEIASIIAERRKPCLLIVNKWDLNESLEKKAPTEEGRSGVRTVRRRAVPKSEYEKALRARMPFLEHAPVIFVSALEGYHAPQIWRWVATVLEQSRRRLTTGALNRVIGRAQERRQPPMRQGKRLKIYYAVQKADASVPTFVLFVNQRRLWQESYGRYLANRIREVEPLTGCPIIFELREKLTPHEAASARAAPLDEG